MVYQFRAGFMKPVLFKQCITPYLWHPYPTSLPASSCPFTPPQTAHTHSLTFPLTQPCFSHPYPILGHQPTFQQIYQLISLRYLWYILLNRMIRRSPHASSFRGYTPQSLTARRHSDGSFPFLPKPNSRVMWVLQYQIQYMVYIFRLFLICIDNACSIKM